MLPGRLGSDCQVLIAACGSPLQCLHRRRHGTAPPDPPPLLATRGQPACHPATPLPAVARGQQRCGMEHSR